jgi:photosystem II stability/assembly factor-like uncharacterized protein
MQQASRARGTTGWMAALALLCAAALPSLASRRGFCQVDAVDRPAPIEPDAARSLLLAVTRAGRRLVAAGERGIVVLSDDDGRSWRQGRVPVSSTIVALCFSDSQRGWAVGHAGVVLRTRDGGVSWSKQRDGRPAPGAEETDRPLLDLAFTGRGRGFIVGAYGQLLATKDGGESWAPWQDRLADPAGRHLYGVRGEGLDVYVVGEQGALYRSADGGESFVALRSPYAGTFFGVLSGGRQVLVFGLRGHAFLSRDRGETWQASDTGSAASLTAAARLDGSDEPALVLAAQSGELLLSRDGGTRWVPLPPMPAPAQGLIATSDGALLVVGARGTARIAWREPGR